MSYNLQLESSPYFSNKGDDEEEDSVIFSFSMDDSEDLVEEFDAQEVLVNRTSPDSLYFLCSICNTSYENYQDLSLHSKTCKSKPEQHVNSLQPDKNMNKDARRCGICKSSFKTVSTFVEHLSECSVNKVSDMTAGAVDRQVPDKLNKLTSTAASHHRLQEYRCICTWCDYKANKYSRVKNHIQTQHHMKSHFPCKECSFVGQTVEDYAIHFNCFHKTDELKYSCTSCSFKCNNRSDLKIHLERQHKKQRTFSCRRCQYKAQELMAIKKHIVKVHAKPVFQCKECSFKCNMKNDYKKHLRIVHNGASGFDGECPDIKFQIEDVVDKENQYVAKPDDLDEDDVDDVYLDNPLYSHQQSLYSLGVQQRQAVPDTHILEEEIFEDQILEGSSSSVHDIDGTISNFPVITTANSNSISANELCMVEIVEGSQEMQDLQGIHEIHEIQEIQELQEIKEKVISDLYEEASILLG